MANTTMNTENLLKKHEELLVNLLAVESMEESADLSVYLIFGGQKNFRATVKFYVKLIARTFQLKRKDGEKIDPVSSDARLASGVIDVANGCLAKSRQEITGIGARPAAQLLNELLTSPDVALFELVDELKSLHPGLKSLHEKMTPRDILLYLSLMDAKSVHGLWLRPWLLGGYSGKWKNAMRQFVDKAESLFSLMKPFREALGKERQEMLNGLFEGAKTGDMVLVKKAMDNNIPVTSVKDKENRCGPLNYAVKYNHIEIARVLIDAGADPMIDCDECGGKAIYATLIYDNPDMFRVLLGSKHESLKEFYRYTDFGGDYTTSINYKNVDKIVPALLECGLAVDADFMRENIVRKNSPKLFTGLIKSGYSIDAEMMSELFGNAVESHYRNDRTLSELLEALLKEGADPHARAGFDFPSAIFRALKEGDKELVDLVLKYHPGIFSNEYKENEFWSMVYAFKKYCKNQELDYFTTLVGFNIDVERVKALAEKYEVELFD